MQRLSSLFGVLVVGGLLVFSALSSSALVVCESCGYANATTAALCMQCKSTMPVSREAEREAPSGGNAVPDDLATADMTEARRLLESGDHETARLFGRNALALNLVTPEGAERDTRAAWISALVQRCDAHEPVLQEVCSLCGGGRSVCRRCGGDGRIQRRLTINERKHERGQALQRYRALQQGQLRVPVGNAWVPASLADSLSKGNSTAMRRACAPGCKRCTGFGHTDCSTCRGLGGVACRESGCERGGVKGQLDGLGGSSGLTYESSCKACRGLAVVACTQCAGVGRVLCQACNGSGLPDTCSRCGGDGLSDCSRCRGSGKYRGEACTVCKGDGTDLCRPCNGSGLLP
jgi:hypothetical protein